MPRANRFLLAIACALLAATGASHAQLDSPAPAAASTTPAALAAPTAVPLAEAIGAADAVAERLAEIESEVSENQTSAIIARELPLLTEQIDTREAEMQRTLEAGRPLASMQELETAWQRLADQLALWNRELSVRATHLDREIALLPDLRATWRSTLAAARSSAAPPRSPGASTAF
jgi:hypothetical protein